METMKLLKKGTREIKVDHKNILNGHALDAKQRPTGRLLPNRAFEVSKEYGEKLLSRYPNDFLNLSAEISVSQAPATPKRKQTTVAVPDGTKIEKQPKENAEPVSADGAVPAKDTPPPEAEQASQLAELADYIEKIEHYDLDSLSLAEGDLKESKAPENQKQQVREAIAARFEKLSNEQGNGDL